MFANLVRNFHKLSGRTMRSYHGSAMRGARVLATDKIDELCIDIFEERGHIVDYLPSMKEDELCEVIGKYDGLVVRSSTKVTEKVLNAATNMTVVGRAGVGVDNVDFDAATKLGVMVMNTPDGNTISTAQLALSLLCNLARKLPAGNMSVKDGKWDRKSFMGAELAGKTIGVIGCGRIGQYVAKTAQGMGMKVIAYDSVMTADVLEDLGIEYVDLDDIWAKSDVITLHAPLTDETRGLLNRETMQKCKDGVMLVNTSRGGIIDEDDLLEMLNSGKVSGAALDVYTSEPPKENLFKLLAHPNLVCTPHLGASTEEAQMNVARDIATQMCDVFDKKDYVGVMNVDYMTSSTIPQMKPFMRLSETMGALISQMSTSKLNLIKLSTKGGREVDITQKNARKLLCAKALHGVVRHQVHDIVPDFISAPLVANENNIRSRIEDDAVDLGQGYRNLVTLTGHYDDGKIYKVSGSVFGSTPHIVHMDYGGETSPFSFKPEGDYVLMFENDNKPGVLRDVLAVLRQSDVNVGSVNVAPFKQNKEKAFSFVILDSDIPTKALKSLQGLESVYNVVKCKMR